MPWGFNRPQHSPLRPPGSFVAATLGACLHPSFPARNHHLLARITPKRISHKPPKSPGPGAPQALALGSFCMPGVALCRLARGSSGVQIGLRQRACCACFRYAGCWPGGLSRWARAGGSHGILASVCAQAQLLFAYESTPPAYAGAAASPAKRHAVARLSAFSLGGTEPCGVSRILPDPLEKPLGAGSPGLCLACWFDVVQRWNNITARPGKAQSGPRCGAVC